MSRSRAFTRHMAITKAKRKRKLLKKYIIMARNFRIMIICINIAKIKFIVLVCFVLKRLKTRDRNAIIDILHQ